MSRSYTKSSFLILILVIFSTAFSFPQNVQSNNSEYSFISGNASNGMRWRLVGPFRAGRALAAAGIPGQSSTFYFGAVDGGVWKTSNAGLTWEPIYDGQINPSIGALAISSSDPNIIYAGTGEADMRSDITYGEGVYKSTDGGMHWESLGLKDTRHIGKILVDPDNPNIVLVAALGHAYAPNKERGVFRTTDGGKSWEKVLYKNDSTGAINLSWDSKSPQVVYASLWEAHRTPWSQYPPEEGSGSGIYKSTNEGKTWTEVKYNGLPSAPFGRIGLSVVTGSGGQYVYALIQALRKGSGLYYSGDGGDHWKFINDNPNIITRMWYFGRVFVDPQNPKIIYIPNRSIFKSSDGGKTFEAIKGSPGGDDYHFVWIDPQNDSHLIEASDQGTSVSLDNGKTWSSWYNQPTAQFYHVSTDNQFPYRIYGAQQDCGTVSITSRSDYGEITFRNWFSIGAGESGYILPDPVNPNIVYGGNTYGGLFRFERVTGQSQVISPWLLSEWGELMPQRKFRFTWTSPVAIDPHDNNVLYYGAQKLLKTNDGGLDWKIVSPDLTNTNIEVKNGMSHKGWGVIYSIAISPVKPGVIWAGTDDGLIQLTKDNGQHWQNVTPVGLKPWSKISIIDASPFNQSTAYAAVDRHRLNDFAPYIYRIDNYGKHWALINKGIPEGSFVRVVRADPYQKGLLYAGTEKGVYISFDDGANWQPLQLNLPEVSVRDLTIHENNLVAATHGRAFWVLDDLTPLRQISKNDLDQNVYLFKPAQAIRIRRSESNDTPLPPEVPHGENPPAGAIIDFYLHSTPTGPIVLKIFDEEGNLVRSYSSNDKPVPVLEQPYFMKEWLPQFHPLTTHAGLNRFTWNLRYPLVPVKHHGYGFAAIAGKGTVIEPQGPMVLPGKYTVKLTVDGKTYSQPLNVKMDPRVKVSKEALNDQLNLALKIWNAASEHYQLTKTADTINAQLYKLENDKKISSSLKSEIKNLQEKINKFRKSLQAVNIAGLEGPVLSADREPTRQMKTGFDIMNKGLMSVNEEWPQLKSNDIKKLNVLLDQEGLSKLQLPAETPVKITIPKEMREI